MSTDNKAILMVVGSANSVPPPYYDNGDGTQLILLLTDPDLEVPPLLKVRQNTSQPPESPTVSIEQADWDVVISNSAGLPPMQFRAKAWDVLTKATDLEIRYVWDFDPAFQWCWTPLQSFLPPEQQQ